MNARYTAPALLIGTVVGAGFLGIPHIVASSGFLLGILHIAVIGSAVCLLMLYLAEIALRTKDHYQLPGYAKKYLGPVGKTLMLVATIGGIYAALVAYLIGQGQSLSFLFTELTQQSLPTILIVWLIFTCITHRRKSVGKSECLGVAFMIILMLIIIALYTPRIQTTNLTSLSCKNALLPFGVIL